VDKNMPVIAIAPKDALLEKLKSNLAGVRRPGWASCTCSPTRTHAWLRARRPRHPHARPRRFSLAILHTVPLQLLAYHAALERGNDVDKRAIRQIAHRGMKVRVPSEKG